MYEAIKDVSKLTTIPTKSLNKLMDRFIYCIVDAVKEDTLEDKEITEIDLYIGKLYIQHLGTQLKYKFIPSTKLEKHLNTLLSDGLNSLECALEKSLVTKITEVYKDLL